MAGADGSAPPADDVRITAATLLFSEHPVFCFNARLGGRGIGHLTDSCPNETLTMIEDADVGQDRVSGEAAAPSGSVGVAGHA
jgi:hypothetical protein